MLYEDVPRPMQSINVQSDSLWLRHPRSSLRRTALPAQTWVEIMHCTPALEPYARARKYEGEAKWYFHAPGSGVFLNTGQTLVFWHHRHVSDQLRTTRDHVGV